MKMRSTIAVVIGELIVMGCGQSQQPTESDPAILILGEWIALDSPAETEHGMLGSRLEFRDNGLMVATLTAYRNGENSAEEGSLSKTFSYRIDGNKLYAQPFGDEPATISFENDTLTIEMMPDSDPHRFRYSRVARQSRDAASHRQVPSSPAELVAQLGSPNQETAQAACSALIELGEAAVPSLMFVLSHDKDPNTRGYACLAIGNIAPADSDVVRMLGTVAVSDADWTVRRNAIDALGDMGALAMPAFTQLVEACKDKEKNVRLAALATIASLAAEKDEELVVILSEALRDEDAVVQITAADAIIRLNGHRKLDAESIVAPLCDMIVSDDVTVRVAAVEALGSLGKEADRAVSAISRRLQLERNVDVRYAMLQALVAMSNDPDIVAPPLIHATEDTDQSIRVLAVELLGEMRSSMRSVLDALLKRLKDTEPRVRIQAAQALGQFQGDATDAISSLEAALADPDRRVREAAKAAIKGVKNPM